MEERIMHEIATFAASRRQWARLFVAFANIETPEKGDVLVRATTVSTSTKPLQQFFARNCGRVKWAGGLILKYYRNTESCVYPLSKDELKAMNADSLATFLKDPQNNRRFVKTIRETGLDGKSLSEVLFTVPPQQRSSSMLNRKRDRPVGLNETNEKKK